MMTTNALGMAFWEILMKLLIPCIEWELLHFIIFMVMNKTGYAKYEYE